jgi:peptidoglycan/xylan/chitin deacetylase (PgdA/CDA1 family)/glycosyltransferase involved in cell wall biosynthesis/2-polyprenyl-3-methyl-5-hydroxy-6-metoxy-1,4-benzoquinol methylase
MNDGGSLAPIASPAYAKRADTSGVSIITPAHNADATLEATLNSVLCQSHPVWEVVIIDDGSTDATRATADRWAHRDGRFRVLRQAKSGVSAARNTGLREAQYPFVLFLDSDDRIAPTHLERMVGMLLADSTLDAVHCGWQRVMPSGVTGRPHLGSDEVDLFQHFAFHCHFAIHACILRRALALSVGGFDTSLITCEDWDFFQRVARTRARFGRVPELLAFYHIRADSASRDNRRCLIDAREVVDRAFRRDPGTQVVARARMETLIPARRDLALYNMITYCAAQEIGAGRDGLATLLDNDDLSPTTDLSAEVVADSVLESLPIGANQSEEDWPRLWCRVSAPLAVFLARLEAQTKAPALAFATLRHLEKRILLTDPDNTPLLLGSTYRVNVDLARQIPDVFLPPEADRLICRLIFKSKPIGTVELPGTDVVTGRRIAEAILEGHRRLVLLLLLRSVLTPGRGLYVRLATVRNLLRYRTLRLLCDVLVAKPGDRLIAARRLKHEVASVIRTNLSRVLAARTSLAATRAERRWQKYLDTAAATGLVHPREQIGIQSSNEWDRVFALPDPWAYKSEYEAEKYARTLALMPEGTVADALEIACAEGHFTVRLAPRVGRLTAVDISGRALARARERCASQGNITFQTLDLNVGDIPGPFDLIVCSEVLYYVRDLPCVVRRILSQVRPGGFLLTAHARVLADDPQGIGFDWNFAFGVETIAKTIVAQPGAVLRRELRTPLYRVLLYQRVAPGQQCAQPEIMETDRVGRMTPVAEALAKWPGRPPPIKLATERACSVPILMYHRIAADGPVPLERFRVAPDLFASQMAMLHRAGYRTIGLEDWIGAMARREPLPGKPIILTFDDGYRDFLTAAMPVLRVHGFSATVFLVAERIGGSATWDAEAKEPAPLLSWDEVCVLHEAGIEFGCHSSVHRPMTGMSRAELAKDTVLARAILEERLTISVKTLAYPYGAQNGFVRSVVRDLVFRPLWAASQASVDLETARCGFPVSKFPGGAPPSVCSQ